MDSKEREITREELYKMVWSKPMTEIAEEFGISDVGLAKVCNKLKVPKPYRGYWQLVEAGRSPAVPHLPSARKNDPTKTIISPESARPNVQPQDPEFLKRLNAEKKSDRIEVSPNLRGAHQLVSAARYAIENGYIDGCGRMRAAWTVRNREGCLDIRVSKQMLPRALRIMDALVKALEARGHDVEFSKDSSSFQINGERVPFYLWEAAKRSERQPTEKEKRESPGASKDGSSRQLAN
jgi:hypothetical protein